jgi:hypothetical protein
MIILTLFRLVGVEVEVVDETETSAPESLASSPLRSKSILSMGGVTLDSISTPAEGFIGTGDRMGVGGSSAPAV